MTDARTQLGLNEYKLTPTLFLGYAIMAAGLLFFGWSPIFAILGLTLEVAFAIIFNIIRTFISPGLPAALIATLFQFPSFLILIIASIIFANHVATPTFTYGNLGILLFIAATAWQAYQRFTRISLPQARYNDSLCQRYEFTDGRPIYSAAGKVTGVILESWLITIAHLIGLAIATLLGLAITDVGENDHYLTRTTALTLLAFGLIRQILLALLLKLIYPKGSDPEQVILKRLRTAGEIRKKPIP